jgi:hypothetical protein
MGGFRHEVYMRKLLLVILGALVLGLLHTDTVKTIVPTAALTTLHTEICRELSDHTNGD